MAKQPLQRPVWLAIFVMTALGAGQALAQPFPEALRDLPAAPLPQEAPRSATGDPQWAQQVQRLHSAPRPLDQGMHDNPRPALGQSTLRAGRNVILMEDQDGSIQEMGLTGLAGDAALQRIAAAVYAQYPDEFDFITIILNWSVQVPFAYYLPLANETLGLGLKNVPPYEDLFDRTEGRLQGFIFMNNWRFYTGNNRNLSRVVWLQEIGHRWGSFVTYDKGEGPREDLLGRDRAHWSYFMHTQNSALEGNDWQDNEDGSFSTLSNSSRMSFGSLDRYLMGLVPSQEVEPFYFIDQPDTRGLRDSNGARLNAASPPEPTGELKTILGQRVDVSIEDIVRAEGPRNPSYRDSQKEWRMATVFLVSQGSQISDEELEAVQTLVDYWEALFEEATEHQMNLTVNLDGSEQPRSVPLGELCTEDAQCDNSTATTCVDFDQQGASLCTRRCLTDQECGQGYCCLPVQARQASFCAPSSSPCQEPDPDMGLGDAGDTGPDQDMGSPPDAAQSTTDRPKRSQEGCGCQTPSKNPSPHKALWGLALGLLVGIVRRRR